MLWDLDKETSIPIPITRYLGVVNLVKAPRCCGWLLLSHLDVVVIAKTDLCSGSWQDVLPMYLG